VLQGSPPHPTQWASWVPKALIAFGLALAALSIPVQIYEMSQVQHKAAPTGSHVFLAHSAIPPESLASFADYRSSIGARAAETQMGGESPTGTN